MRFAWGAPLDKIEFSLIVVAQQNCFSSHYVEKSCAEVVALFCKIMLFLSWIMEPKASSNGGIAL